MGQSNVLVSPSDKQAPGGAGKNWVPVQVDNGLYAWMPPEQKEAFAQSLARANGHIDVGDQANLVTNPAGGQGIGIKLAPNAKEEFHRIMTDASLAGGIAAPILARFLPGGAGAGPAAQMLAGLFGASATPIVVASTARDKLGNDIPPKDKAEEILSQMAMNFAGEGASELFINPAARAGMEKLGLNRAASVFKHTPGDIVSDVRMPGTRATLAQRSGQLAKDALDQQAFPYGGWKGGDVELPSKMNLDALDTASKQAVANAPGAGVNMADFLQNQKGAVRDAAAGHGLSGMRGSTIAQGRNIRSSFLRDPLLNPRQVRPSTGEVLQFPPSTPAADFQDGLRKLGGVTDFIGNTSSRLPTPDAEGLNLARQATYNSGSKALADAVPGLQGINDQFTRTIPVADAMHNVAKKVGNQNALSFSEGFGLLSPAIYGAGKTFDALDPSSQGSGSDVGGSAAGLAAGLGALSFLRRPAVSGNMARALTSGAKKLAEPFTSQMVTRGLTMPLAEEANTLSGQPVERSIDAQANVLGGLSKSRLLAAWVAAQKQLASEAALNGGGS